MSFLSIMSMSLSPFTEKRFLDVELIVSFSVSPYGYTLSKRMSNNCSEYNPILHD
jgi:hypothetical protein